MARGPKKHLKRINTPQHWYMNKLQGIYAPRPSCGPHRIRECIPMALLLRDQLRYAYTYKEVRSILETKAVKVDGKVRTDRKFPLGLMDVVHLGPSNEYFRIVVDVKGRYKPVKITKEEASYKLLRVDNIKGGAVATNRVASTHDGRNINYVDKKVKHMDTLVMTLADNEVRKVLKFKEGAAVICAKGRNMGRVGTITNIKTHPGEQTLVTVTDAGGKVFSTRLGYIFVVGEDMDNCVITFPKGDGLKKSKIEDRDERIAQQEIYRENRELIL